MAADGPSRDCRPPGAKVSCTRCIVLCAGDERRWNRWGGCSRKHFLEIDDEAVLTRTLRLLSERPDRADLELFVVVRAGDEDLYDPYIPVGTRVFPVEPPGPGHTEAYKYLSSRPLWNLEGRTVVLLGDVWYSEAALAEILDAGKPDWTAFGRANASVFTRKPHGEVFAMAFWSPEEHGRTLDRLDMLYRSGGCRRPAAGWAHYRLMIGENPETHGVGERFVEIDDFTEDFDSGHDVEAWSEARDVWNAYFSEARTFEIPDAIQGS